MISRVNEDRLENIPWARKLKLRHLEVFLAVHQTGSLTAAAAQLHMTQPALSHWLSDMEEVVGRPLFLRNRRLALTVEGEVLRQHATRMLRDVYRTDEDLKAVQAGLKGRLHIGSGLPRVLFPKSIVRLHEAWPDIFVSVVEAPFSTLLEMMGNRQIDLIVGALGSQAMRSGFATESLIADAIHIVARPGHPCLEEDHEMPWEELARHPWILPPVGSEMRTVFDDAFASKGLRPPVPCAEAGSSIRAHLLAGDRPYLSILLGSEVQLYRPLDLQSVPIKPPIRFPDIGAVWDSERANPVVEHFLDALRAESRLVGTLPSPD